jgi:hypothetical protein
MYQPTGPGGSVGNTPRFRLETGLELLDSWAETAGQVEKNAVYRVLFAVADGSVCQTYKVAEDHQRPNEFAVLVRADLVLEIRLHGSDSFGIHYLGPVRRAKADPVAD